jgi:competence protein ComGF
MNKGFILIEALIAFISMSLLLSIMSGITFSLIHLPKIPTISQLDVFILQFDQLLTLSTNFRLLDEQLCFDLDIRSFCIKNDENRLVKTPGYEILLDDVNHIQWELNDNEIIIQGIYNQKSFTCNFQLD